MIQLRRPGLLISEAGTKTSLPISLVGPADDTCPRLYSDIHLLIPKCWSFHSSWIQNCGSYCPCGALSHSKCSSFSFCFWSPNFFHFHHSPFRNPIPLSHNAVYLDGHPSSKLASDSASPMMSSQPPPLLDIFPCGTIVLPCHSVIKPQRWAWYTVLCEPGSLQHCLLLWDRWCLFSLHIFSLGIVHIT